MSSIKFTIFLSLFVAASASADIWKWVDASGKPHFVDTLTSIYTWVDEHDKIHYSDKPDHEDAVAVLLVWHSAGRLEELSVAPLDPAEEARLAAEAEKEYYCKKATENYEAYKGAPRLYRTDDKGEREYLSDAEARATLLESKAQMDEYCS